MTGNDKWEGAESNSLFMGHEPIVLPLHYPPKNCIFLAKFLNFGFQKINLGRVGFEPTRGNQQIYSPSLSTT